MTNSFETRNPTPANVLDSQSPWSVYVYFIQLSRTTLYFIRGGVSFLKRRGTRFLKRIFILRDPVRLSFCLSTPIYFCSYCAVTTDIQLEIDRQHNFYSSFGAVNTDIEQQRHFFEVLLISLIYTNNIFFNVFQIIFFLILYL